MKKTLSIYVTILFLFALLVVPGVYAQEDTTADEKPVRDRTMELKKELQNTRQEVKKEINQQRSELKVNLDEKREEAKEQFAAERKAFQADLKGIEDEQKQQIITQVDERLQELNAMKTDLLLQHLDRIAEILTKIEDKAAELSGDTEPVDEAVAEAREAITAAEEAIAVQAGTEYIVEIGEETELRAAVQGVVKEFKEDMRNTIMTVREAHKAAITAARALAGVRSDDAMGPADTMEKPDDNEATESADTE